MKIPAIIVTTLLCISQLSHAAPLNPDHVAADAKWLLHMNLEALHKWDLVQTWHDKMKEKDEYKTCMKMMSEKLGMNPATDLLGVTIYSDTYGDQQGVMIIHMRQINREKMAAVFAEKHPDAKSVAYGDNTISVWTEKHGRRKNRRVAGSYAGPNAIVLSNNIEGVMAALDVIDGEGESLSKNSELMKGFVPGAILACRAIDVDDEYKETTRCPVLKRCQEATMSFAVKKGKLRLKYDLVADSDALATQMKSVIVGLRSLAQLKFYGDKDAREMVDALDVSQDDSEVSIRWSASSDDFAEFLEERMKKWKEMRGKWKMHGKKKWHHPKHHKKQDDHDDHEDGDDDDDD